jgi:hypothetical protein
MGALAYFIAKRSSDAVGIAVVATAELLGVFGRERIGLWQLATH